LIENENMMTTTTIYNFLQKNKKSITISSNRINTVD
jgi:hypothetical protein